MSRRKVASRVVRVPVAVPDDMPPAIAEVTVDVRVAYPPGTDWQTILDAINEAMTKLGGTLIDQGMHLTRRQVPSMPPLDELAQRRHKNGPPQPRVGE